MFEVLHKENAFWGVVGTSYSGLQRGSICYKSGINSSGDVILDVAKSSVTAAIACYPIDKITMRDDLADDTAAIQNFSKNERCIYYEGGIFRSDLTVFTGAIQNYSTPTFPTATVAYTVGAGQLVYLYPSTASGKYGKLKSTSGGLYTITTAKRNANFILLAAYNATPTGIYTYKVIPNRIGAVAYQSLTV